MTGRVPENLRGFTPLMRNSFSRLNESSLNRTGDSGYQSSFASLSSSFTPSSDESSRLYCSTPVTEDTPVLDTPRFSEDRIPCIQRTTLPLCEETDDHSTDVLSCLIRNRTRPATQTIFSYLQDEDLFRLCQVSVEYCRAVLDDQPSLKRLSRFLIAVQQNGENRLTMSHHHNNSQRPFGGVLRPIENVLSNNLQAAGTVWTVPSPVETIDLASTPSQFKSLIVLTKTLSEHHYVTSCHTCRCLVAVRLHHNNNKSVVECSNCYKAASGFDRRTTTNRRIPKPKASLFSSFR